MAKANRPENRLERKILELILAFPERIYEMETRNDENCRRPAAGDVLTFRMSQAGPRHSSGQEADSAPR